MPPYLASLPYRLVLVCTIPILMDSLTLDDTTSVTGIARSCSLVIIIAVSDQPLSNLYGYPVNGFKRLGRRAPAVS